MKRNPTIGGKRKCTQCGNAYPDTPEYFPYGTRTKDGTVHLRADCRTCYNERSRTIDARRRRAAGVKPRNLRADPAKKPIVEPLALHQITEKRCSVCGRVKPVSEYCTLGGVRLMARCKACHNEANRRARQETRRVVEAVFQGNEVITWTRPPSDAHWGYCPEHGWGWSNGAGPHRCACGRPWAQVIAPARVCECIKA